MNIFPKVYLHSSNFVTLYIKFFSKAKKAFVLKKINAILPHDNLELRCRPKLLATKKLSLDFNWRKSEVNIFAYISDIFQQKKSEMSRR